MATIAFIGSDGAGKTTIIRMIQNEFPDEVKYMYMGLNLESSNYSLPTSRLILSFKLRSIRKEAAENGNTDPEYLSTHHISHRTLVRGRAVKALRTINRILEAGYRQLVSWLFETRGYIIIYDRHFLFDTAPNPNTKEIQPLSTRIFRWFLKTFFPKTDLVIFLDADPQILLNRKQEVPFDYLTNQRAAIVEQGRKTKNFVTVDASQPINKVYAEVFQCITQFVKFNKINGCSNDITYGTFDSK